MNKNKWVYNWGSWGAEINQHPRRNEYTWTVFDINGDFTYDFHNHIDTVLESPAEAEDDMFNEINRRLGHEPERQINK